MPQIPVTTRIATDRPLVKIDNLAVPDPAAGQAFSITVPVGYRYQIASMFMRLVTDANVADRIPTLQVSTPSGIIFRWTSPFLVVASETRYVTFAPGLAQVNWSVLQLTAQVALPPTITLEEGSVISISIAGIQATDQISLINAQILSQFVAE